MSHLVRLALAALVAVTLAGPAAAQAVNPTELSVQEQQLLDQLAEGDAVSGRVTIPNRRAADLIKPEGRDWTAFHNGTQQAITVWSIVGMLALLAVFYLVRGRIRIESGFSGRRIRRFGGIERFAHWLTALSFIVLALTGLNLVIGRYVLMPLIGPQAFGTLTAWGKVAHNYLSLAFMVGLVLILLLWIKDNIPTSRDATWLAHGGGFFKRGEHIPARRFNAGQKLVFWAVLIGGGILSFTGLQLLFPAEVPTSNGWQFVQMLHGITAAVMVAVILGHIYIGTLGMEGAFSAMGSGEVDLNWAREHHSLWVEEKLGADARRPGPKGKVAPAE